jgi:hypothetical protein
MAGYHWHVPNGRRQKFPFITIHQGGLFTPRVRQCSFCGKIYRDRQRARRRLYLFF